MLVEQLYEQLTAAGLKVWWDKKCLRPGQRWEDGFVDGLLSSVVIVPVRPTRCSTRPVPRLGLGPEDGPEPLEQVLSARLLQGFERLTPGSACDNVLLEHIMMHPVAVIGAPLRPVSTYPPNQRGSVGSQARNRESYRAWHAGSSWWHGARCAASAR